MEEHLNISEGDLHDFNLVLKRNNIHPKDFILECGNKAIQDQNKVKFIESQFEVMCKSTQVKKNYDAGPGTLWLEQFETDLKQGLFTS